MDRWFEVFRAGEYPQGDVAESDLDDIVRNYNPAVYEAPLVIGHPEMDAPAYGWVAALKRAGSKLLVQLKNVPDTVQKLVNERRYSRVSIKIRRTGTGFTLRHVGLLGAAAPAVEGLEPIRFNATADDKEYVMATDDEIREQLRKEFDEKLEAERSQHRQEMAALQRKERQREIALFVEEQVKAGRLTPAQRDGGLLAFMEQLDAGTEIAFGEEKKSPAVWFGEFLKALPKAVELGEVAGKGTEAKDKETADTQFAADGAEVDKDRLALHSKAVAYQREHECTYEAAVAAVI